MNIFVLDKDIEKSAKAHCNPHVVKMPLETAQLLCTARHELERVPTPFHTGKPMSTTHAVYGRERAYIIMYGYAGLVWHCVKNIHIGMAKYTNVKLLLTTVS